MFGLFTMSRAALYRPGATQMMAGAYCVLAGSDAVGGGDDEKVKDSAPSRVER
jgi:hypothetical protein